MSLDERELFFEALGRATDKDQQLALKMLAIAAVLDGRTTRDERRLLDQAAALAGRSMPRAPLTRLRRTFEGGRPPHSGLLDTLSLAKV